MMGAFTGLVLGAWAILFGTCIGKGVGRSVWLLLVGLFLATTLSVFLDGGAAVAVASTGLVLILAAAFLERRECQALESKLRPDVAAIDAMVDIVARQAVKDEEHRGRVSLAEGLDDLEAGRVSLVHGVRIVEVGPGEFEVWRKDGESSIISMGTVSCFVETPVGGVLIEWDEEDGHISANRAGRTGVVLPVEPVPHHRFGRFNCFGCGALHEGVRGTSTCAFCGHRPLWGPSGAGLQTRVDT